MVEFLVKEYISLGHIPPNDLSYRGVVHLLYYLANDSSVSCYHYTDRIAEAGAIPQLLVLLRDLGEVMALQTVTETVGVLEILAKRHEVDFNCIERLVSLIREVLHHVWIYDRSRRGSLYAVLSGPE